MGIIYFYDKVAFFIIRTDQTSYLTKLTEFLLRFSKCQHKIILLKALKFSIPFHDLFILGFHGKFQMWPLYAG